MLPGLGVELGLLPADRLEVDLGRFTVRAAAMVEAMFCGRGERVSTVVVR